MDQSELTAVEALVVEYCVMVLSELAGSGCWPELGGPAWL